MFSPAHLIAYLLYISPTIGLHPSLCTDHCYAFKSGQSIATCNRVFHTDLPDAAEVAEIKSLFADEPFTWIVDARDTKSQEILKTEGLIFKGSYPAMAIVLDDVSNVDYENEMHVKIIDVNGSELAVWAAIVSQSFNVKESALLNVIDLFKRKMIPNSLILYLGCHNEQGAVAGMAIRHPDVISFHWIGTLPEFRKNGLGSALTQAMLIDAKKSGYRNAILFSSLQGKSVYERLGFREYVLYAIYGNY